MCVGRGPEKDEKSRYCKFSPLSLLVSIVIRCVVVGRDPT